MILEQAPPALVPDVDDRVGGEPVVLPWVVSGRSESALRAQSERLVSFVGEHAQLHPKDVAFSLVASRSVFEHRAVVLAGERAGFEAGLS
ncbi:hypothetical protein, partial [Streptomyces sp. SID161]|uniref:CurL C-terminal domain-containing protein n=1 Tax=Streptomyces sp. SID161 TaxID=2690251 RepID=UPI001F19C324